jgi:CRP/FNR family transcriptional regulator, cyclic AMP receptor protein
VKALDWSEFLRRTSFLSTLDEHTRRWLVSDEVSAEHSYEPGAVIIREGENGDSIFLIGSGSAEAVLSASGDRPIVLSVMGPGETFGEMGFFERRPRSATVRAREMCLILEIKGHELRSLADARPEVGFRILLQVSERLRSKNEQILMLHLKSGEAANRAKDEFVAMLAQTIHECTRRRAEQRQRAQG